MLTAKESTSIGDAGAGGLMYCRAAPFGLPGTRTTSELTSGCNAVVGSPSGAGSTTRAGATGANSFTDEDDAVDGAATAGNVGSSGSRTFCNISSSGFGTSCKCNGGPTRPYFDVGYTALHGLNMQI